MKRLIAAAAVLAVTSVNAAEELKFGDLNFFVPATNFQLSAIADFRTERQTAASVRTEDEGYFIDTLLTYGLSDRLNLYVGLNYQYKVETENLTNPSDDRYSSDGLANPAFGALYRVFTQSERDYNFDLGATARVRVQDAKTGDASGASSKDGNAADGRHNVDLYGRLGKKWNEANEWQVRAGVIQHLEGESESLSATGSSNDIKEGDSTDFYVRASYQYRPVNEFMMTFAAQAMQVGEETDKNKDTDVKVKADSHLDWDFDFTAKYLITSNLIARFNLGMGRNPDYKADVGGTKIDIEKRRENRLGLGVDWLF